MSLLTIFTTFEEKNRIVFSDMGNTKKISGSVTIKIYTNGKFRKSAMKSTY